MDFFPTMLYRYSGWYALFKKCSFRGSLEKQDLALKDEYIFCLGLQIGKRSVMTFTFKYVTQVVFLTLFGFLVLNLRMYQHGSLVCSIPQI